MVNFALFRETEQAAPRRWEREKNPFRKSEAGPPILTSVRIIPVHLLVKLYLPEHRAQISLETLTVHVQSRYALYYRRKYSYVHTLSHFML